MAIIWVGGEDMDFPNGTVPVTTTSTRFRTGYARCALGDSLTTYAAYSQSFGGRTDLWASARIYSVGFTLGGTFPHIFGVTNSTAVGKGIFLCCGASGKARLTKFDGTTETTLATESGTTLAIGLHRLDMQIIAYGASGTVNVYIDNILLLTFTGNISVGPANLDQVSVTNTQINNQSFAVSEVMVADEDTRGFSLVTMAPNAAGTTAQWTGLYTDISEVTLNDATLNVTNTATQDQQYNLIDLPSGNFVVKELMVAARANVPAGSTATKLALGVRSGSTVSVGSLQTPTTAFGMFYQAMGTNDPATGSAWTTAAVNALQMNLRSG